MNLKLSKKKMKNLTAAAKSLPSDMTPQIAGGIAYTWGDHLLCDPGTRGCAFSRPAHQCV